MAVSIQVLESGDRNHIIHVVGVLDSAETKIVNVATLPKNSKGQPVVAVRLDKLSYDTDKLVSLAWDADTDKVVFVCAPGQDTKSWEDVGGINNDAGTGKTGSVNILAPTAASYTLKLCFIKKY